MVLHKTFMRFAWHSGFFIKPLKKGGANDRNSEIRSDNPDKREFDGKPVYWVAAYLVDGLLIDTGCHETSRELGGFLEGMNLQQVVNTHYHEDHTGGNHDIMTKYGVREKPVFTRSEENIAETVKSMHSLLKLQTDKLVLFTAVGKVVENGRKALADCIVYLTELASKVKDLNASGLNANDIVNEIFGGEHSFMQITDGQFSTCNLVNSLLETDSDDFSRIREETMAA